MYHETDSQKIFSNDFIMIIYYFSPEIRWWRPFCLLIVLLIHFYIFFAYGFRIAFKTYPKSLISQKTKPDITTNPKLLSLALAYVFADASKEYTAGSL